MKKILFDGCILGTLIGILCIGHELFEFMAFSDYSLAILALGGGLSGSKGRFFGGPKRRREKAGKKARKVFTESVDTGINMFNDMYADDYDMIQSGIGNFKNLASDISKEAATPYLNTIEGQAFSNQIDENTDQSRQRFANAASQLNLSDEAVVAGMNNINKTEGNSFRTLSSNATNRQNQLRGQKLSALAAILSGQQGLLGQKMNASGQGLNYGSGASGAYNQGFGMEAQRQSANTQAFTGLLSDVLGSFAGAAKGG